MKSVLHAVAMLAVALVLSACGENKPAASASERAVTVFAASSLTDIMHTVGELYEAAGHPAPKFNFAASSALAHQIEQGGEADVFISADEAWMDYVAGKQLIDITTRKALLTNTLVLVTPAASPIAITIAPGMDLAVALKGGKLALADPDSVPAGNTQKRRSSITRPGQASRQAWRDLKTCAQPCGSLKPEMLLPALCTRPTPRLPARAC